MFTGIIEATGKVVAATRKGPDMRLEIDTGKLDLADVQLGDSIAVNGVCLTAVVLGKQSFTADVSGETLDHTTLGGFQPGRAVNLEKALTPNTRLGGHIVTGHVDGVGKVVERHAAGESERFRIEAPKELAHYIARKGSICVDGISLTVNAVGDTTFDLNIVPHTLAETTLGGYQSGQAVNLEVDIIARYLERMLGGAPDKEGLGITLETLRTHGFTDN